jgi:hypothetical protein
MRKILAVFVIIATCFCYLMAFAYMPKSIYMHQGMFMGFMFFIPYSMFIWKIIAKASMRMKTIIIVFIITLILYIIVYINGTSGLRYLDKRGLL